MSALSAMVNAAPESVSARASVSVHQRIEDVADAWQRLENAHCTLASQKYGLISAWIEAGALGSADCVFIVISLAGVPVALLPLMRKRAYGLRVASWFTGDHLGSYAPLIDLERWRTVAEGEQVRLWRQGFSLLADCDLVHLPDMPASLAQASGLSVAFGGRVLADCVHISRYDDWASCDAERRDKRRRKVDRQQGSKLAGRGEVNFEIVTAGAEADGIIDTMFAHRAERFKVQGIRDPFRHGPVKAFYKHAMQSADGILHVLRLDGQVIAVRYNIEAGGGLYSLITSMHPSPDMQFGSPGKQNLLHAMQASFDGGYRFIDMGKGESDEKRLWCNEKQPLMAFAHALTPTGRLAAAGLAAGERAKGAIKTHPALFDMYRKLRSRMGGRVQTART
jgi:CelD/BcsL family acetyltransferase involved in cellulose biosynthesis|tara:strand:+ start:7786 stop:8967 length:1182 start_codon:yes stop_codon:yes gene_type:complete